MTRWLPLLLVLALLLPSCGGEQTRRPVLDEDFEVDFRGYGADMEGVDCTGFKLSKKQAEKFLEQAREVTWDEIRKTCDWSPCYAWGVVNLEDEKKRLRWEIRQNGVGRLIFNQGESMWLVCTECETVYAPD
ncbi:MAG: hypothetical protein ACLFOY_18920 [Desulfatibacillaceae bacterium]